MKKIWNSKTFMLVLVIAVVAVVFIGEGKITFANPGSQEDPLITLSFVEKRLEQFRYYIDQKLEEMLDLNNENKERIAELEENLRLKGTDSNQTSADGNSSQTLEVVQLLKGQRLICKAGTEIILRSGKATAIVSDQGGLSDVTAGVDLKMGQNVPKNHLLIIPRDDGRGIVSLENAFVMVRGGYIVQ